MSDSSVNRDAAAQTIESVVSNVVKLDAAVGHFFNYIHRGKSKFEDYFNPDIAAALKVVKAKYDPSGLVMKGGLAAP